jgi:hypothetical protein
MRRFLLTIILLLVTLFADAQCAMCRATLENNVSQGNPGIAAGINFGILYLLVTPYLAILCLFLFWWRSSKRTLNNEPTQSVA